MTTLGGGTWMVSTAIRDVGALDPALRARMNLDAPGFQCAVEALYAAVLIDADGAPLSGDEAYRLSFPPGGVPPVGAFWSITMYAFPEMLLTDNAIQRYAIGSNFNDLTYEPDGSLEILMQTDPPKEDSANWLPSPPGSFMLICRLYQPGIDLIEGRFCMPPLVKLTL